MVASEAREPKRLNSPEEPEQGTASWWGDVWSRFSRQTPALIAAIVLLFLVLASLLAPLIAPHDPAKQFRNEGLSEFGQPLPPNAKFWLGTDQLGRDLLSRLLYGGRVSLAVGLSASVLSTLIAVLVGGVAGYVGGALDFAVMRFVELVMSVPTFFLMLLLVVILGQGVGIIVLVIAVFGWPYPSRVFRGQVLAIKEQDFVDAATALGAPPRRVLFVHIMPHLLPLVVTYIVLRIPSTIFAEVGLSFIGLGVPPPTPTWGSMMRTGIDYYRSAPWIVLFPGIALSVTTVTFNLVGRGLREAMDPALRGR